MTHARRILFFFLFVCTGWPCRGHAQELVSDHWDIGPGHPELGAFGLQWYNRVIPPTENWMSTSAHCSTARAHCSGAPLGLAVCRGRWLAAGHDVGLDTRPTLDPWPRGTLARGRRQRGRLNEAWQWGTWDGMGWAWNPNQADIALARIVGTVGYSISPSASKLGTVATIGARVGVPFGWTGKLRRFRLRESC